jgi:hypothetical protein
MQFEKRYPNEFSVLRGGDGAAEYLFSNVLGSGAELNEVRFPRTTV